SAPRASSFFFFSSRRRHTSFSRDWSSDVCSSDLLELNVTNEAEAIERIELPQPIVRARRFAVALEEGEAHGIGDERAGFEPGGKIGRAWCRESGYDTVAAVSCKVEHTLHKRDDTL